MYNINFDYEYIEVELLNIVTFNVKVTNKKRRTNKKQWLYY